MKRKITIFILLFIIISFSLFPLFVSLAQKPKIPLEVQYPSFPGVPAPPRSGTTDISRYLLYIYGVTVALSGIVVFVVLIYGGIKYLTSAGNPSKMSDAKDQIFAGFIGLGIVLASFLILNEINPELTNVSPPLPPEIGRGIILYTDKTCGAGADGHPGIIEGQPPEGVNYIRIEGSRPLPEIMEISSIYSFHDPGEEGLIAGLIEIDLYDNTTGEGEPKLAITRSSEGIRIKRGCIKLSSPIKVGYVKLKWYLPGVWLFNYENGDPFSPEIGEGKDYAIFQADQHSLPTSLKGQVKSIALVADTKNGIYYGAILHGSEGLRWQIKKWSHLYLPKIEGNKVAPVTRYSSNATNESEKLTDPRVYSITVFRIDQKAPSKHITFCRNKDCEPEVRGDKVYPAKKTLSWEDLKPIPGLPPSIARGYAVGWKKLNVWKELGEKIEICAATPNLWEYIARAFGKCASGISAVFPEEESQYLLILFIYTTGGKPELRFNDRAHGDTGAIIAEDIIRFLGEYHADNALAGFVAIKVAR